MRDIGGTSFLTVRDLAQRWHVTPQAIYNRIYQGHIPDYIKPAGRVLFDLVDVKAYELKFKIIR